MTRRTWMAAGAGAALGGRAAAAARVVRNGRLKQSVCKWCFKDFTLEHLSERVSEMGLAAIDLLGEQEWPVVLKYGLVCSMGGGICSIKDGMNRKENHAQIEANFRRLLPVARQHRVPNLITFSGNRAGMGDEEAWENCAIVLNKVKAQAEDTGVSIIIELLNSKVNHPDYQCDRTAWGVELCKRVNSPRVKLLYDVYHMQIMEGDVIRTIGDNIQWIGHFHTGGNPGRNEIDESQELNYPAIARTIVELKFDGYCAHEFIPLRDPLTSLRRAVELCDV